VLTRYDEFLCHQSPTTFDHVETSAREWTERVILHFGETAGKFHLSVGVGLYPNRNVIDAFAVLNVERKTLYVVRASRELRPRPDEVAVGPFSHNVPEPLRRIHCRLDENPHGLAYDVEFDGIMPASEEAAQFTRRKGRVIENVRRYVQAGRGSGRITYEGNTITLDKQTRFVGRDHSWGVRRTGAEQEAMVEPPEWPVGHLYSWGVFQFERWGAAYHIREDWDGTQSLTSGSIFYPYGSGKPEVRLAKIEHDFKFRPDMRKIASGQLILTATDGTRKELAFKPLNYACITTGGYQPYRGFVHGQWKGIEWMDGSRLDLTDETVLKEASFLDDESLELRCGNEVGYGVFEQVVVGKYPRYGFQGY